MSIQQNLRLVQDRIARACDGCGRDPAEVTLIAVTKTVGVEHIQEAFDLGLRHFGESKLQEALPKIENLSNEICWHFIGKLQSNKVKKAAEYFRVIHSFESESQLREIDKGAFAVDGLIEVNIGLERQKSGILPGGLDNFAQSVLTSNRVRIRGLMTVGPAMRDAELLRPYYKQLRELLPVVPGGRWLSMGMSSDFEVAIQEGATHIRVGTALFGSRG